jgi:hypothetical protein
MIRAYTDDGGLSAAFLTGKEATTTVASIHREHTEAFIASALERAAPSSAATAHGPAVRHGWLSGEIAAWRAVGRASAA